MKLIHVGLARSISRSWFLSSVAMLTTLAQANLIANGSFENGSFTPNHENTMSVFPAGTNISNWVVSTNEIAWISDPNPFGFLASNGIKSLDLMGYHDALPTGRISQSFGTTPGIRYRVLFDVPQYSEIVVNAAGSSAAFQGRAIGHPLWWITRRWTFNASAVSSTLEFYGGPNTNRVYAGLDNVVVDICPPDINGHVDLLSFDGSVADKIIELQLRQVGTSNVLESANVDLDSNGNFVYSTSLPIGIYDVSAKGNHWLRKVASSVNLTTGLAVSVSWTLINGDADPDNEVNIVDYGTISTAFGSVNGDSNWNPLADLDGDEEVNLLDVSIISSNFGISGDE